MSEEESVPSRSLHLSLIWIGPLARRPPPPIKGASTLRILVVVVGIIRTSTLTSYETSTTICSCSGRVPVDHLLLSHGHLSLETRVGGRKRVMDRWL
jgi:hypothetical protein